MQPYQVRVKIIILQKPKITHLWSNYKVSLEIAKDWVVKSGGCGGQNGVDSKEMVFLVCWSRRNLNMDMLDVMK